MTQEKKSFFSLSSKSIFMVATDPHGWEVPRRLEDFKWLSHRLKYEFPSVGVDFANKIQEFDGKDREDIESYMNYLLSENEVLHSRFLIFFLSCTNQTKFEAKREKEYNKSRKSDKWLHGNGNKKQTLEGEKKGLEDTRLPNPEQNPEDNLNQFLSEAGLNLSECHKLYKR